MTSALQHEADGHGVKRCSKCGHAKPRGDFYAEHRAADGLASACKACVLDSQRRYREAHRDQATAYRRRHYADPVNRAKKAGTDRAYYEANREDITRKQAQYRAAHREEKAAADRAWRDANRDRKAAMDRAWAEANPDRAAAAKRRYHLAHQAEDMERAHAYLREGQAETLPRARRYGYQWTGPELELAARRDLTAKQVALMTGRTVYAVNGMRLRLRDDPKTIALAGLTDPADAMTAPGLSFGERDRAAS